MIDRNKCMAPRDDAPIGGARCQEKATHETYLGRRCALHAESMRVNLRNPNTLGNMLAGERARTEEEIAILVRELPSLTVFERVLERLQEDGAISAHVEIWADGTPYISFSTCRGSSGVALLIRYMETR